MSLSSLILIYVLFRLKHFVCDFLLQSDWMALTKGKPGREGYQALFIHAGIHALGTLLIVMFFAPTLWWLAPLDFVVHSIIDRIKGYFTYKGGWAAKDSIFWWTLGLDQEAHNFSHLAYIIIIVWHLGGIV